MLRQFFEYVHIDQVILDFFEDGDVQAVAAAEVIVDSRHIDTSFLADFLTCRTVAAVLGKERACSFDDACFCFPAVFAARRHRRFMRHSNPSFYDNLWRNSQAARGRVTAATASMGR